MADGLKIDIDASGAISVLNEALAKLESPGPLLSRIAEDILFVTKQRFENEKGPDGTPWKGLKKQRARQGAGTGSDKILQDTRNLFQSLISTIAIDGKSAEVGTNLFYAPFHQFGTSKGLDPRPFLGVDENTEQDIIDITLEYLGEVFD